MRPPGYPSAWLRTCRARFRFVRQDHFSSTMPIRLNFRLARHPPGVAKLAFQSPRQTQSSRATKFFQRQMNIDRLNFLSLAKVISISSRTDFDLLTEMVP
jgi:hypothetical protein